MGGTSTAEIELALVADVDDHGIGRGYFAIAGEKMRDLFDRLLRGRKADAHRRLVSQRFQPLERKRQVRAALVVGDGVNFVDDHGLDVAQDGAALVRGQQNVERLGRGHQNVRRALQHRAPLFHQRVAGANGGANLRHQQAALAGQRENFAERDFEIFLDVVAQRFQRRNIENFGAVGRSSGERFAHQAIDAGEKCGQRFAGSGGRGNERGAAGENVRPALLLRLSGRAEALDEPLRHQRMRPGQGGRKGRHRDIVAGSWVFVKCSLSFDLRFQRFT